MAQFERERDGVGRGAQEVGAISPAVMAAVRARAVDEKVQKAANAGFGLDEVLAGGEAPHRRQGIDGLADADADVLAAFVPAARAPHDLVPHRQHALLPQFVGEGHVGVAARVVAVERDRARHQRLQWRVVKVDVVGRELLLADHLDDVVAALRQLVAQGCALGQAPLLVQPVISQRQGLDLIVAALPEVQLHQLGVGAGEVDTAGTQARGEDGGVDGVGVAARGVEDGVDVLALVGEQQFDVAWGGVGQAWAGEAEAGQGCGGQGGGRRVAERGVVDGASGWCGRNSRDDDDEERENGQGSTQQQRPPA